MSEQLKPCPFCGGGAEVFGVGLSWEPVLYGVRCIEEANKGVYAHGHQIAGYASKKAAAEAWNMRHVETCEDVSTKYGIFECSKCGCTVEEEGVDWGDINFCPDCGRRVIT